MCQIKEIDTSLNYKRVAQNIKLTVKHLEKLEKSGITISDMTLKSNVDLTNYAIIYKIKINPKKKLIVKKVIRHK